MVPLNIVFAGAGEFGVPTLRALFGQHRLIHVFTQPDRPAGRGRKLTPTPIAAFVESEHPKTPLTRTADLNAETLPPCDVLVVIAFGQKIAEHVTTHPRLGAVNLHASRLPKYRGAAPNRGESRGGRVGVAPWMDSRTVPGRSVDPSDHMG